MENIRAALIAEYGKEWDQAQGCWSHIADHRQYQLTPCVFVLLGCTDPCNNSPATPENAWGPSFPPQTDLQPCTSVPPNLCPLVSHKKEKLLLQSRHFELQHSQEV